MKPGLAMDTGLRKKKIDGYLSFYTTLSTIYLNIPRFLLLTTSLSSGCWKRLWYAGHTHSGQLGPNSQLLGTLIFLLLLSVQWNCQATSNSSNWCIYLGQRPEKLIFYKGNLVVIATNQWLPPEDVDWLMRLVPLRRAATRHKDQDINWWHHEFPTVVTWKDI